MIPEGLPLMNLPISFFFKSNARVLKVMLRLEEGELARGYEPPPISWVVESISLMLFKECIPGAAGML